MDRGKGYGSVWKSLSFFEQPDAFPLGYGLAERLDGVKRCLERADEAGGSVTGSGDDLPNEVASTFLCFRRVGCVGSILCLHFIH
jgi:hypothetical protein